MQDETPPHQLESLAQWVRQVHAVHDMGGAPAGTVDTSTHSHEPWEKRVDALMMLLSSPQCRLLTVDELRRNIESLGMDAYEKMSYYERWMYAITQTLIQRGVLQIDEIAHTMEAIVAREKQTPL